MTFEQIIACIAIAIQLIGISFYIRGMIRGTTKPNRVTWIIWALAPFIGVWLQLKAGASFSVIPIFMAGFNPVLVVIASFLIKRGYWQITKLDILCGILAIFALIVYILTFNFSIS